MKKNIKILPILFIGIFSFLLLSSLFSFVFAEDPWLLNPTGLDSPNPPSPSSSPSSSPSQPFNLELTYPKIKNAPDVNSSSFDIVNYVKYIFYFAVSIVGFIILFVFIKSGVLYLASASSGNVGKIQEAKNRIISALLGAGILLGSVLIFNTINPEIIHPKLPIIEAPEIGIEPGIYICNYKNADILKSIKDAINSYTNVNGSSEEKESAKKTIKQYISYTPDYGCTRITSSIPNIKGEYKPDYIIFQIPEKKKGNIWEYNYGIILHSKPNYLGYCNVMFGAGNTGEPIPTILPPVFFSIKSITLFYKSPQNDPPSTKVTFFQCLNRNEFCFSGEIPAKKEQETYNIDYIAFEDKLKPDEKDKQAGVRSISIEPEKSALVILQNGKPRDENFFCEVITQSENNLLSHPIGRCDSSRKYSNGTPRECTIAANEEGKLLHCLPCAEKAIIIKGNKI